MAKENETIADIIAEMRGIRVREFQDYADRLEAAHRRKVDAIEADALSVGGLVEAMRQKEAICTKCRDGEPPKNCQFFGEPDGCSSPTYGHYPQLPIGDAAKLREADHNWDAICEKCLEGEPPDECRYYGEPCGCDSPMYREHPKPFGENAAVLRSAIIEILSEMEDMAGLEVGRKYKFSPDAMVQQCRDALAAPPRNCDRFDSSTQARAEWYKTEVLPRVEGVVSGVEPPFVDWLFAPATEKEGGAK